MKDSRHGVLLKEQYARMVLPPTFLVMIFGFLCLVVAGMKLDVVPYFISYLLSSSVVVTILFAYHIKRKQQKVKNE